MFWKLEYFEVQKIGLSWKGERGHAVHIWMTSSKNVAYEIFFLAWECENQKILEHFWKTKSEKNLNKLKNSWIFWKSENIENCWNKIQEQNLEFIYFFSKSKTKSHDKHICDRNYKEHLLWIFLHLEKTFFRDLFIVFGTFLLEFSTDFICMNYLNTANYTWIPYGNNTD